MVRHVVFGTMHGRAVLDMAVWYLCTQGTCETISHVKGIISGLPHTTWQRPSSNLGGRALITFLSRLVDDGHVCAI